jgi:hypothetical protein
MKDEAKAEVKRPNDARNHLRGEPIMNLAVWEITNTHPAGNIKCISQYLYVYSCSAPVSMDKSTMTETTGHMAHAKCSPVRSCPM